MPEIKYIEDVTKQIQQQEDSNEELQKANQIWAVKVKQDDYECTALVALYMNDEKDDIYLTTFYEKEDCPEHLAEFAGTEIKNAFENMVKKMIEEYEQNRKDD